MRLSRDGPRVQSPPGAERLVEIYLSPFNTGDCVSLVARMITYIWVVKLARWLAYWASALWYSHSELLATVIKTRQLG